VLGMLPMALGAGEGGEQNAPLGLAVIGGLAASTIAALVFLPAIYAIVARKGSFRSPSLDPDDPNSPTERPTHVDASSDPHLAGSV
ncbi:MAG TPA: efflux RND transporter permease subunit, partial [Kofleriaceae bacterium]